MCKIKRRSNAEKRLLSLYQKVWNLIYHAMYLLIRFVQTLKNIHIFVEIQIHVLIVNETHDTQN